MEDSIYELYTGDYIDIRNLIAVHNVEFETYQSFSYSESNLMSGIFYFSCSFRFIKDPVKFYDCEEIDNYKPNGGEDDLKNRQKFVESERQKLVKAWRDTIKDNV